MASKIKLSNANGKIVTIENNDSNMSDVTLNGASITKKVDTLANMRAMNELPETVWCSGYHTKNDGVFGSHIFRLKGLKTTETDNSGTLIVVSVGGSDYVYELQFSGAVNVKWFGAKGDGITDDTIAFQKANSVGLFFECQENKTYNLQNFIPLDYTIIDFKNSKVQRNGNVTHESTGSSAAIVIQNSTTLKNARFKRKTSSVEDVFHGAILIEDGNYIKIDDCRFEGELWAGIFGNNIQNGTKQANNVYIEKCIFNGQKHNLYLADIKNLFFSANTSINSIRDGLKTYRNCENHIITNNFIYDNGDGTVGQSQDGIDLFIAGFKTIITGNYIYGNTSKGIDIKYNTQQIGESATNINHIITNNFIYDNGDCGIEVEVNDTLTFGYLKNVSIFSNEIYSNTLYGIKALGVSNFKALNNNVYNNGNNGIRVDNCKNGVQVINNNCSDNLNVGILISADVISPTVKNNDCISTGTQTQGIVYYPINGICKDNNIDNNHTSKIVSAQGLIRGSLITSSLDASVSDIAFISDCNGIISNIAVTVNNSQTGVLVQVNKRNKTTGANESTLFNANVDFVAHVPTIIPISTSTTARTISSMQSVYIYYGGTATSATATVSIAN